MHGQIFRSCREDGNNAFYDQTQPGEHDRFINETAVMLEEVGYLFKNDPIFGYLFTELPKGMLFSIIDKRRERMKDKNNALENLM